MRVLLHNCTTSSLALGLIGFSFVLSLPYRGFVGDLGVVTHNGHVSNQVERYLLRRVCVILVGYSAHRLRDSGVVALRFFCFVRLTCVSFLVRWRCGAVHLVVLCSWDGALTWISCPRIG